MSDLYLIVGLGNPGKKYQWTRHNCGFLVVQSIAEQNRIKLSRSLKYQSFVGQGMIEGKNAILVLPQTFMNKSGSAVKSIVLQKGIALEKILIVCDDFHLAFGQLRFRACGSDGGHNGLASVIQSLGSRDFARLRVGVGKPSSHQEASDFVLTPFNQKEIKAIQDVVQQAAQCCLAFLSVKVNQVMNLFNKRKNNE